MSLLFKKKYPTISMADATQELKNDTSIVILDVRRPDEYAMGHIRGSKNVPLDVIQRGGEIPAEKGDRIFVHCLSGGRSRVASEALIQMGYENITNIGGISSWQGEIIK